MDTRPAEGALGSGEVGESGGEWVLDEAAAAARRVGAAELDGARGALPTRLAVLKPPGRSEIIAVSSARKMV